MLDKTTRFSKDGRPYLHFNTLNCFAEYVMIPDIYYMPISKHVPLTIATLINCTVTTGMDAVLNTSQVKPGSSVAVINTDNIDLSIIINTQLTNTQQIIAIDTNESKKDLAQAFNATDMIIASPDPVSKILHLTKKRGADYIFEAVNVVSLQEQYLATTHPNGTTMLIDVSPMNSKTNLPNAIITHQEKTIINSYYDSTNTSHNFPLYADLYLNDRLELDKLVTATYQLDQINNTYAAMLTNKITRDIIVFESTNP